MKISLYKTNDDKRQLNKTFSNVGSVNATPYENISILKPRLIISYNSAFLQCNACYIPEFQRYYFIDSIDLDIGGKLILNCSIDVLSSFKTSIQNLYCKIVRQENLKNDYLIDTELLTNVTKGVAFVKGTWSPFSNVTNSSKCVALTVMNGGTGVSETNATEGVEE